VTNVITLIDMTVLVFTCESKSVRDGSKKAREASET